MVPTALVLAPVLIVMAVWVNGVIVGRWGPERRYYRCEETIAHGCHDPEWSWLHHLLP